MRALRGRLDDDVTQQWPAKVRVFHIITGLNVGGAENMLAKLIEQGGGEHEKSDVLSLLAPGPIAKRIEKRGVAVHTLGMRRGLPSPMAIARLTRLVNALQPDLIHGWMYHGNIAASFARRVYRRRVPVIWNIRHSIPDLRKETRQTRLLLRLSARLSRGPDAIIYNAQVSRLQHEEIGYEQQRGQVIPNGFDVERYTIDPDARRKAKALFGLGNDTFRIACIARLHPMKDQARLIRAVAIARENGCDAHLVLVGHGLEEPPPEIAEAIAKSIPPDRITISGARFDVAEWLPGMDLLAVPSAWGEAFPNVIGEAFACGIPVVATNVGDCALIVKGDGIVVPPSDTGALVEAILALAKLPAEDRQAMGGAGRQRVKRDYAISKIAQTYAELYSLSVGEHRPALKGATALSVPQSNER